jgi:hypothetical protein
VTDKIVSIGLLTETDLARLGKSFTRHFPIVEDELFGDLMRMLDELPAVPEKEGSLSQS